MNQSGLALNVNDHCKEILLKPELQNIFNKYYSIFKNADEEQLNYLKYGSVAYKINRLSFVADDN